MVVLTITGHLKVLVARSEKLSPEIDSRVPSRSTYPCRCRVQRVQTMKRQINQLIRDIGEAERVLQMRISLLQVAHKNQARKTILQAVWCHETTSGSGKYTG